MKTNYQIKKHLTNGEVTTEMLAMAAFAYNKRAKNMRDNERYWRVYYQENCFYKDTYGKVDEYKGKKEDYYRRKDECLSFVEPVALHIAEREKYDCYTRIVNEYYMYYTIGTYSFHHPITEDEFHKLKNTLPVVNIGKLITKGEDIENLMSVQTADKIRKGLKSGRYRLVA